MNLGAGFATSAEWSYPMTDAQVLTIVSEYRKTFKRLVWKTKPWTKPSPPASFQWCKLAAIDEVTLGNPEAKAHLVSFLGGGDQVELDLEDQLRSVA